MTFMTPLGFYLSVVAIITIVSILGQGFILTVNIQDWCKGRKPSPVDQILVAFSLSSPGLSYSFGSYIFLKFLWPQFFLLDYTLTTVFALMLFLTLSNSWLMAWLSLYFFAKIVPFKSSYFVKLKMTIDVAVPWLILFTEVVAFSSSLPLMWSFGWTLPNNSTSLHQASQAPSLQLNPMYYTFALGFSSNSAFFIVLLSSFCIVWSLCRHTSRMKKTMSSESFSRLRTHQKAAQTVVSLLLIYVVFYVTYVLMTTVFSANDMNIYYWITVWVSQSTSLAMSLVLILGNSKLSTAFHQFVVLTIRRK
ncbi:taste receptor type 2 member 116-like [Hyla sarda]|uniref:taste receptor type 2 member 116-like n=1 Tax=Hyla sarda TaxID=327740 RepID=UPI0024C3FA2D|nr:taste receptor type 2 member 116-like [Hyla sarda]